MMTVGCWTLVACATVVSREPSSESDLYAASIENNIPSKHGFLGWTDRTDYTNGSPSYTDIPPHSVPM